MSNWMCPVETVPGTDFSRLVRNRRCRHTRMRQPTVLAKIALELARQTYHLGVSLRILQHLGQTLIRRMSKIGMDSSEIHLDSLQVFNAEKILGENSAKIVTGVFRCQVVVWVPNQLAELRQMQCTPRSFARLNHGM